MLLGSSGMSVLSFVEHFPNTRHSIIIFWILTVEPDYKTIVIMPHRDPGWRALWVYVVTPFYE